MTSEGGELEPWPDDIWETAPARIRPAGRPGRARLRTLALVAAAAMVLVAVVVGGWWLVGNRGNAGPTTAAEAPGSVPSRDEAAPRSPITQVPATQAPATQVEPQEAVQPQAPPNEPVDVDAARSQLTTLTVAEPVDDGRYDRELFPHWSTMAAGGCNTRCVALRRQRVAEPSSGAGGWWSVYDQKFFSDAASVEVDHVVSLKEAWISGAAVWDDNKRELFANDLDGELLVVGAEINQKKSDEDVAEWQPPARSAWCVLAARVVKTKAKWSLTVDLAEKSKLVEMLSTCR